MFWNFYGISSSISFANVHVKVFAVKLISYKAIRPGFQALGSLCVQLRLRSKNSHTEVMFMPGDGVDHLMPDGTTEPDADGAYWCASSTAAEKLPNHSTDPANPTRRAGKYGGVRFKRINPSPEKWLIQDVYGFDPVKSATWFRDNQGMPYDWKHILSFIAVGWNWVFRQSHNKVSCTESCAASFGFNEPDNLDPKTLPPIIDRINRLLVETGASR